MKKILLICLTITSVSYKSQHTGTDRKNKTEQRKTFENAVYEVDIENKEMLNAVIMAKNTFSEFELAIKSNHPDFKNFTLKKPFESPEGDEHLWIKEIMFYAKKNKYVGIIADVPMHTEKVKMNDIVEIDKNEISDWMYFENNVVKGGYTLRVLRNNMTAEDRKLFDTESGYLFE